MTALLAGDCLDVLPSLPEWSIDAVVTDPPYGLSFMGKAWDHGVPGVPYWSATLRTLKPGGYLLAFGGTRTHHRLTCAIEDAGFEIRDCLMWLYGQGFPKGKGCLKPGWEPIVLARKPGPRPWLNIDGCRIDSAVLDCERRTSKARCGGGVVGFMPNNEGREGERHHPAGRWPANVVLSHEDGCREVGTKRVKKPGGNGAASTDLDRHTRTVGEFGHQSGFVGGHYDAGGLETVTAWECAPECAVRLLDEQSGFSSKRLEVGVRRLPRQGRSQYQDMAQSHVGIDNYPDRGGASRFFYCAKASPAERGAFNDHPTVKPLALMRWLVRLVTPAGGTIIDPFCGSGSTLIAADREGFSATGIDSDPHAIGIARRRLAEDAGLFANVEAS